MARVTASPFAIAVANEIRTRLTDGQDAVSVLAWLTGFMGFQWSRDCDPQQLRGLGIACSCTAGPHGLLMNWCAAVDRKCGRVPAPEIWTFDAALSTDETAAVTAIMKAMASGITFSGEYRNWRGVTRRRHLEARRFWNGSTTWHPQPGLMLTAVDLETNELRDFRVADFDLNTLKPITP